MRLISISVSDFRNIESLEIKLDGGVNVICGRNAEGKTNLLESIWMLTGAKSFRTSRDGELIKKGRDFAKIIAAFFSEGREKEIKLSVTSEGREISLNRAPAKRASSFAGTFCCVCFAPDNMSLVSGAPSERRRFLDTSLCQLYPSYIKSLKRMTRLNEQKNSLLKSIRSVPAAFELLEAFDSDLAAVNTEITLARLKYLCELKERAAYYYEILSESREKLDFSYCSTLFGDETPSVDIALKALEKARGEDIKAGYSTVGAHRDELLILLCGQNGRSFSSQGQKRSIVLSMKLAEADIFEKITGERPVLLLDDVLSELDEKRQSFLISCLENTQAVITGCDESSIKSRIKARIFKIEGGKII